MHRQNSASVLPWLFAGGLLLIIGVGLVVWGQFPSDVAPQPKPALATDGAFNNNRFGAPPADPYQSPELVKLALPGYPQPAAIWGSTGRDSRGHVWIGVSTLPSAQLLEFVPAAGQFVDRGFVLEKLKQVRPLKTNETQSKIHSRIVQGADGWLYFTSSDEKGENEDGSQPPMWGSHLWRLHPTDNRWEHLLAAPEGLIAVAGHGRYIYALGYWDHVLYQFDCTKGKTASVHVGSVGGHISRNFVCDHQGHAYVPRLRYTGASPPKLSISLAEFDVNLRQVGESRLANYAEANPSESHGIIGVQEMADQSIFFVTHLGYLYRVVPSKVGAALVLPLGSIHPQGRSYTASLFTFDGKHYLMGASRRSSGGSKDHEWIVYDVDAGTSKAMPLKLPINGESILLYGSQTRDDLGNFYLVGSDGDPRHSAPLAFQVRLNGATK